ncbi:MAG: hypothetical protein FJZ58_05550 [Chlamydiae bacterium]|nr:hypothetical protein [Chlamydiota bacterium]
METRVTIDNLGFQASQRYALDQKLLEESRELTQGSRSILDRAEISVVSPSFHSECDALVSNNKKNTSWALFSPPHGYSEAKKHAFTHDILPSLSIEKAKQLYKEKIKEQKNPNVTLDQDSEDQEEQKQQWQTKKEEEESEKEKECLLHFLDCISHLGQCMLYANIKRVQYHKG